MVAHEISERARADRLKHIRSGLMQRMRGVCRDTPDELFQELVDRMSLIQLKYELHEATATPDDGAGPDAAPYP